MNSKHSLTRGRTAARWRAGAAVMAVAALSLTACSGDNGAATDSDDDSAAPVVEETGPVTIRFSWWGSDTRHETTQKVIELFEEKNPNITVTPDYTDWGGYWDKLATTVAGGDTPDVMTQEERYLSDYAARGVLADMNDLPIATDKIDSTVLESGQIDGGLYGVATGVNAYSIVADPAIFEEAGVEMPDDTTWTWEDFVDIANEISANTPDGTYGVQDFGGNEAGFSIYARQHGESLYDADGKLGYSEQTLTDWNQMMLDIIDGGGEPDAARSVEIAEGGPEQSLLGTNKGAMGFWWSNQLSAISAAAGRDLVLLRAPGESEAERTGMYFKPAMYYSVSKTTEHPAAAAKFVDFLLNDPEAGALILSDRGLPANTDVREAVAGDLAPADQQAADFLASLSDDIVDGPAVPPEGAADIPEITSRINTELIFERMSAADAAKQFTQEAAAAIGQ
ncbi:carbohydrate ABC transporter substrate-binding protein (CUT1 family) [Sediminihabitans luteus]|uniref:Carbohydrate ABC transporter substrate-binding protein (CUT1 family) n=1 Tax=Sediminihabitans luteus TaxID=1138585 RepID=A0A2M9CZQ6_9CELL|nr:extracellular solute-binding protein [Sediminihabitans luteus]PJJ77412.1 carbohydrate ABC transporter substrate-binding protein (CUT1 family) [Sediminihabitans luteus]GII98305.1 sugar ABC transporter substrate-binding protein [Sediminihabitans luteus]